jgi:hypothetical protein
MLGDRLAGVDLLRGAEAGEHARPDHDEHDREDDPEDRASEEPTEVHHLTVLRRTDSLTSQEANYAQSGHRIIPVGP